MFSGAAAMNHLAAIADFIVAARCYHFYFELIIFSISNFPNSGIDRISKETVGIKTYKRFIINSFQIILIISNT